MEKAGASVYFAQKAFSHRVEKLRAVPSDLGLTGESIALTSSDGIPLKAWWVPAEPTHGAVVVLHGMDGFDASCLLPQAKFLHDAGGSTLALDMRAHGRSGGKRMGLSLEEPRDVSAALDWLGTQASLKGKPWFCLACPWEARPPFAPPPPVLTLLASSASARLRLSTPCWGMVFSSCCAASAS